METEIRTRSCGLINKRGIRDFLLEYAVRTRAHKFTRVSPEVYDQISAAIREQCRRIVHAQPSKGQTIK